MTALKGGWYMPKNWVLWHWKQELLSITGSIWDDLRLVNIQISSQIVLGHFPRPYYILIYAEILD